MRQKPVYGHLAVGWGCTGVAVSYVLNPAGEAAHAELGFNERSELIVPHQDGVFAYAGEPSL